MEENEESMTWLVFNFKGEFLCSLAGKSTPDDLSEHGERSGPRRVYCDGRLCVRRFDGFFWVRQDEPHKDRQEICKQAWPHHVKGTGQKVCVPSLKDQVKENGKLCGQKKCKRWQKTGRC